MSENEEEKESAFIQTYLRKAGWMVSTMYRHSSAIAIDWYYESIIWKWDEAKKDRTDLVYSEDSGNFPCEAYSRHAEIVKALINGVTIEELEK